MTSSRRNGAGGPRRAVRRSPASDIFSAGSCSTSCHGREARSPRFTEMFDQAASSRSTDGHQPDPAERVNHWLQKLCTFEPDKRPTAAMGDHRVETCGPSAAPPTRDTRSSAAADPRYPRSTTTELRNSDAVTPKYVVESVSEGQAAFGVATSVIDTLGDVSRALSSSSGPAFGLGALEKKSTAPSLDP